MRRHQPEPRRGAGRRGASRAGDGHRCALLERRRPARSRGAATSSFSASSTGSRRESRARCSPPGPGWSSTSRPTSGSAITALYERYYGDAPGSRAASPASATGWPTSLGAGCAARAPSPRPAASPPRRSSRSIRWPARGLDVAPSLFAVTGSSGAGVQPKPTTHHPMRAHNLFAYSVLGHRHEAEVLQSWREWIGPTRRDCPAHDSLGSVRPGHLSHAARQAARRMVRSTGPPPQPGIAKRTPAVLSSGCWTRRRSSPMRLEPTTP